MKKLNTLIALITILLFARYFYLVNQDTLKPMELQAQTAEIQVDLYSRLIEKWDTDNEIVLLAETGVYNAQISDKKDNWTNYFTESNIALKLKYQAIITIPTNAVTITRNCNDVYFDYSIEDMQVKSIEILDYEISTDKKIFGKKYTAAETGEILDNCINKIRNNLYLDNDLFDVAEQSLIKYCQSLCNEFNYNYIDNESRYIKYNHPNEKRSTTEYLIIHSTNNYSETANAQAHFNYWNNTPDVNVSANFVVDDIGYIECVQRDFISWGVSRNKWLAEQPATNANSINIEICNNKNVTKAKENAIMLVRELKKQYPNAQAIRHFDANGKETCPNFTQKEWEQFLSEVNK